VRVVGLRQGHAEALEAVARQLAALGLADAAVEEPGVGLSCVGDEMSRRHFGENRFLGGFAVSMLLTDVFVPGVKLAADRVT
jgi:hypothetical protein